MERDDANRVSLCPRDQIVGRVTKVGSEVSKFKLGDLAAVGCMVDSDGTCPECQAGLEQFCPNTTYTYNSPDKHLGGVTYGGYSDSIVVDQRFVLRVPPNLVSPARRRCFAPESQRTHPCVTRASPRARKLAWSDSAGWDMWA